MGGLLGHVALGAVFLVTGLWHLYNHIKLHVTHRHNYRSPVPWFPTSLHRHLELYLILAGCILFSISELHSRPRLDHYEHSSMAMAFVLYCLSAIALDRPEGCTHLVWLAASLAFAQELLLFHFHSTDHVGVERQYHLLLELVVLVCLATTLMGIAAPTSFAVGFARSFSVSLQGVWLGVMGVMLWTPQLTPKGCSIRDQDGRGVVACAAQPSLDRAKALVNIEFCWILIGFTAFAVSLYLAMMSKYEGFMVLDGPEDVRFKLGDEEGFQTGLPKIELQH